ncbi:hypothetical protein Y043_6368 [Burkholderia pseudomallei MSHR2138]|nr:hypothetical protein Y043_6368 [Burkholderia pseudomallei MSHR2138]
MRFASPAPPTMMVSSLRTSIRFALPSSSSVAFASCLPVSSETTVAPVRIAMSSSIARRRSPKPGALTAATFSAPRIALTTSVASASPSMSSATISNGLPACVAASRMGSRSRTAEIFLSCSRISASSR